MFRASSSDVSEFTDVALSFVNMLTDQATETVTIRTFSNQKPWVDRTIRAAVNQRTATYNAGLFSGNMSEYKASCYALRRAVRAAKLRYRERIELHPSCSYDYLFSPNILFLHILFVLHFLFYCTFYSLFLFFYLYIYALVLCYFYIVFILLFSTVH